MTVLQKLDDPGIVVASSWRLDDVAVRIRSSGATGNHLRIRRGTRHPSVTDDGLKLGNWFQVAVAYDGSGKASGVRIYVDGQRYVETVRRHPHRSFATASPLRLGARPSESPSTDSSTTCGCTAGPHGRGDRTARDRVPAARSSRASPASAPKSKATRLPRIPPDPRRARRPASGARRAGRAEGEDEPISRTRFPTVMVMAQMESPATPSCSGRGDYRNHLDKVTPAVPATLPPLPHGAPLNRLGWLSGSWSPRIR